MVGLFAFLESFLNCFQAFNTSDVQPADPDTDFAEVEDNTVEVLEGHNQTIEWRSSKVTVFEKDEQGNTMRTALLTKEDGGILKIQQGWTVWIAGGKFIKK
jgi:hypothetical protein